VRSGDRRSAAPGSMVGRCGFAMKTRNLGRLARRGSIALLASAVCLCGDGAAGPAEPIRISHSERSLQPGEVVLFNVAAPAPLEHVEAVVLGRVIRFYPGADGRSWSGLVGIDLGAKPGELQLSITVRSSDGESREAYALRVDPAKFGTRRLTLPAALVTPPKSELPRIARENARVSAILEQANVDRLWALPFVPPVPGVTISRFGRLSIMNGRAGSRHNGIDLRAAEGSPVCAPNAGRVVLADELYYSGRTIILDHGEGLFSYLGHFSRLAVGVGDMVAREQLVGYAGATGRVTGPHVHWGVRLGGARVDPLSLLAVFAEKPAVSP
jgi:murein DD-endopeptidase MepM/ murein hydrolase activator NlpD